MTRRRPVSRRARRRWPATHPRRRLRAPARPRLGRRAASNQAANCLRKYPERSAAAPAISSPTDDPPRAIEGGPLRTVEGRFRWWVEGRRPSTVRIGACRCAPLRMPALDVCAIALTAFLFALSPESDPKLLRTCSPGPFDKLRAPHVFAALSAGAVRNSE